MLTLMKGDKVIEMAKKRRYLSLFLNFWKV